MPGNPFGDYGDVDLSDVYYGSQAAAAAATGQPVSNPEGTNAPHGVDPATGLALKGPPPPNPERDRVAAQVNQTVRDWLVANGRPPTDGISPQELIGILPQDQLDLAIQHGLFGPPGQPSGGYTKSTNVSPAATRAAAPAGAAAPQPPDPANDYSQELAALDKYIANLSSKQSTATSADGSVTVSGALGGDPQLKVYQDRRAEYAARQATYDQQKATYEAWQKTPAGMAPSANPVEGQRVLSSDPNAVYRGTPTQNPDGTVSYAGYTMVGSSISPAQQKAAAAQASNPNTMIGNPGIGMGGVTPQQAAQYNQTQVNKATRMYERALPPDPNAAPPPPSNAAPPPGTRPVRYPIGPGGAIGEPRSGGPVSNGGRPNRDLSGPSNPPTPSRITMPTMPGGAAQAARKIANKVGLPGQNLDWLDMIRDRFDDIELRIRRPRAPDVTIPPGADQPQ